MIKVDYADSFWAFDHNQMLLEGKLDPWSKGDSLGRNAFMYIFHPHESFLKKTLLSCVKVRDDGLVQFYRYPNENADNVSRDHVSAVITALYINQDYDDLKMILNNLPLQLSRQYWQTLDFWLWQKTLKFELGGRHLLRFIFRELFLGLNLLMFLVIIPWNFLLRFMLGIKQIKDLENQDFKKQPKWKIWVYQKLIYPHYALYNLSWMLITLKAEGSILNSLLRLDAKNFLLKVQLGRKKKITKEEYESYQPISSFQWAGTLDKYIDNVPRLLTEPESRFNDITKSNLNYFYFQVNEAMRFKPEIIKQIKSNQPIVFY